MPTGSDIADYQTKVPCTLLRIANYYVVCFRTQIVLFNEISYIMTAVDLTPAER